MTHQLDAPKCAHANGTNALKLIQRWRAASLVVAPLRVRQRTCESDTHDLKQRTARSLAQDEASEPIGGSHCLRGAARRVDEARRTKRRADAKHDARDKVGGCARVVHSRRAAQHEPQLMRPCALALGHPCARFVCFDRRRVHQCLQLWLGERVQLPRERARGE
jgi:hypothetical protein